MAGTLVSAAIDGALLTLVYLAFKAFACAVCKTKFCIKAEALLCAFVFYIGVLISVLITDDMYCLYESRHGAVHLDVYLGNFQAHMLNLIPFKTIAEQLQSVLSGSGGISPALNLAANFLLFAPMPVFIMAVNKKLGAFASAMLTLCCVLGVELVQFFIGRSADIDDVILNMAGAVICVSVYQLIKKNIRSKAS